MNHGGYGAGGQGAAPPDAYAAPAYLDITLEFSPLQFILSAVTPVVVLNGQRHQVPWGRHVWPMPPGEHHLDISFPYMLQSRSGPAMLRVAVYAGHLTLVKYTAPTFMWSNGTAVFLGHVPAPAANPMPPGYGRPY
ncbi:MAG: hypothetical protein R3B36_35630 [Polyangiaceae bacterium]